uniref:Uncharacterized protein n=1 Tax=Caenorhabditis japonica TaxID=281687 RepID=A0A8R1IWM4_CAEJA
MQVTEKTACVETLIREYKDLDSAVQIAHQAMQALEEASEKASETMPPSEEELASQDATPQNTQWLLRKLRD